MKKVYNKLVRDKIPKIISDTGVNYEIKIIKDDEFKKALGEKLIEEAKELIESDMDIEEMADVFEVIDAILKYKNWSKSSVKEVQKVKRVSRGSFNKGIFLIYTDDE